MGNSKSLITQLLTVVFLLLFTVGYIHRNHQTQVTVRDISDRVKNLEGAFKALTRTNWVFKDARSAAPGYYMVTVASPDAGNLGIQTLEFTLPAKAFSIYLRNMDRYGEPRALKGKPVTFRLPQGPPYGEQLVFNGLLEFAVIN